MDESFVPGSDLTLIWTRDGTPFVAKGVLKEAKGQSPVISLAPDCHGAKAPKVGERVVLCFEKPEQFKVTAKVASNTDGTLHMETRGLRHRSRREYPRIDTQLGLVFRLIDAGGAKLSPLQAEAMEVWSRPIESSINFAVSGLAFISPLPFPVGATLSLRFTFLEDDALSDDGSVLEVEGLVVRSMPIPNDEAMDEELHEKALPIGHNVALQFVNITPELQNSLTDFTLHEQEMALGIDGDGSSPEVMGAK